jgi:pimeloyl-ACP methyl ester carboxylesterase
MQAPTGNDQSGTLRSQGAGERIVTLPSGVKVRTYDEGSGPVVLLLHGNPDNADEWKTLIQDLKKDFRCVAPDLPGYGARHATFPLPERFRYTRAEQTAFVSDVLQALHITEKVTLVVHDIGGIMGVPWAAENLSRLHAVVYTNTVAYPKFRWFGLARVFGASGPVGSRVAAQNMRLIGWFGGRVFRTQFGKQNPQLSAAEIDRFTTDFALNDTAKETTLRQFRELVREDYFAGYDGMVKAIAQAVPTVALWGDNDPYLVTSWAEQLYAKTTIILPKVGHWVPIVAAKELAEKIRSLR